jgi:hypothetical protein
VQNWAIFFTKRRVTLISTLAIWTHRTLKIGPDRACKVRALALHCGLWLLQAWAGLVGGLGVWTAGLPQKSGPHGLRLLGYVVKAQARMSGLGLGPIRP